MSETQQSVTVERNEVGPLKVEVWVKPSLEVISLKDALSGLGTRADHGGNYS